MADLPRNKKEKLKQYRTFLVLLVVIAVVWFFSKMSSTSVHIESIPVKYEGVDTARFVVTDADSAVRISVEGDGFSTLFHYFRWKGRYLTVSPKQLKKRGAVYSYVVDVNDYKDAISSQYAPFGRYEIVEYKESLTVNMRERHKKGFVPKLEGVEISFADQYGLGGVPRLEPDSIFLYGSEESLAKITSLHTCATKLDIGRESDKYELELDPVWQQYPDLRVSQSKVLLSVPVEAYTEKEFEVKVNFESPDTTMKVKLYPERVTVRVWVPQHDYLTEEAEGMTAVVRYNGDPNLNELPVAISRFPSNVRIKKIEPEKVQYVIIK